MKNKYYSIYDIAAPGTLTPEMADKLEAQRLEKERLKQQFRHDWKITLFNVLGGAIAGLVTSIIFWLVTK